MRDPGVLLLAAPPSPTEVLIGRVYVWMATNGLEILIWILGAVLLARLIRWGADKYASRVDSRFSTSDLIVQTEDAKHRRALVDVVAWTLIVVIAIIAILIALLPSLVILLGMTVVLAWHWPVTWCSRPSPRASSRYSAPSWRWCRIAVSPISCLA